MDSIQDNAGEQLEQNQKDMCFNINDSIWIAAAAMTYEIYYKKQNAGQMIYVSDFAFVQSDICNRTKVINGHRAEVARTSQWCCGDHENHTYCFLRAIENKRRLSFPGEFGGKEEPESLKMAEVISTDVGRITIRQLHDFVHKEYAVLEEQIRSKTDIDYMAPLEYIDKHSKEEYAGPKKPVPPEQRAKMDELKERAKKCYRADQADDDTMRKTL